MNHAIEYASVWEHCTWGMVTGIALAFVWWSFGKMLGLWLRWFQARVK